MQFARNVQFKVKTAKEQELKTLFEREVLPENGFVNPKGAHFISLWDNRRNAEAYGTATYPTLFAKLTQYIVGTPQVETYETASSFARA